MFSNFSRFVFGSIAFGVASFAAAAPNFTSSFAPKNDLWKQDKLEIASPMTKELFNKIIANAQEMYDPMASERDESLEINANWNDPEVNANCMRSWGTVTVNMYGGLARRPEVTPEGFALVLCHELGHAYGGTPYVDSDSELAAEGQSDYYGAQACLLKVLPKLTENPDDQIQTAYTQKVCNEKFGTDPIRTNICLRQLSAGQSLGNLLSVLMKEAKPNYETPDKTIVSETSLDYPATVQCRMDTYFNGSIDAPRPACWFKN